jgi:hypothetical protein
VAVDSDFFATIAGVNASVLIAVALDWRGAVASSPDAQVKEERRRAAKGAVFLSGLTCIYAVFTSGGLIDATEGSRVVTLLFCLMTTLAIAGVWTLYFHEETNNFVTKMDAVILWAPRRIRRLLRWLACRMSAIGVRHLDEPTPADPQVPHEQSTRNDADAGRQSACP